MTHIELIHHSRKYADQLLEHDRNMTGNEEIIRKIVFECWKEAYQKGLGAGMNLAPYKEDMGQ